MLNGKLANKIVRRSLNMLNNGGRFTKPVDKKNSAKKQSNSNDDSSKWGYRENIKNVLARPTWSLTSIRNSMTVSPRSFSNRKSLNSKRITRKISRPVLVKKVDKKMTNSQKEHKPLKSEESISIIDEPNISTYYATCRIHCYENNSHTFEIIEPRLVNCFGDGNEKSDIVIVVLANGQTALYTSKSSDPFVNTFYHEANRNI